MNCDFGQIPLPGASIHNVRLFTHTLEGKYWGQHCGNLKWIQETATGFLKPSLSLSLYRSSGVHGLQNSKGCPAELWVNIPGQPCYRTQEGKLPGTKLKPRLFIQQLVHESQKPLGSCDGGCSLVLPVTHRRGSLGAKWHWVITRKKKNSGRLIHPCRSWRNTRSLCACQSG